MIRQTRLGCPFRDLQEGACNKTRWRFRIDRASLAIRWVQVTRVLTADYGHRSSRLDEVHIAD